MAEGVNRKKRPKGWEDVTLATVCDGKAVDIFNQELDRVLDNIMDNLIKCKGKREIILKFALAPTSEERGSIMCGVTSSVKLNSPEGTFEILSVDLQGDRPSLFRDPDKQGDLEIN